MKKLLILTLAVFAVAACSKPVTSWQKSGVSQDQWSDDRSQCHNWSRRQAERDYTQSSSTIEDDATDIGFTRFMSTYDSRRSQQRLMEDCLRRLGYQPAETDGNK